MRTVAADRGPAGWASAHGVAGSGGRGGRECCRGPAPSVEAVALVAATATVERRPLLSDRLGDAAPRRRRARPGRRHHLRQRRARRARGVGGPGRSCTRLEAPAAGQPLVGAGFGARYDARQKQVHRQTNRFWPQALGTTPWGAARWLRDHVPAAGRYRVRLVDDTSAADVRGADRRRRRGACRRTAGAAARRVVRAAALRARDCVPDDGGWRVYEPTSGQVRRLDLAAVARAPAGRRCSASTGCTRRCCRPDPYRNAEVACADAGLAVVGRESCVPVPDFCASVRRRAAGAPGKSCRTRLVDLSL